MTSTLFIVILITIIVFTVLIACVYAEDGPGFSLMVIIAGVVAVFIFWTMTPDMYTMLENKYRYTLQDKPDCLNKNPESISCLKKYKKWLKDSIWSVERLHELDSIKHSLKGSIDNLQNPQSKTVEQDTTKENK